MQRKRKYLYHCHLGLLVEPLEFVRIGRNVERELWPLRRTGLLPTRALYSRACLALGDHVQVVRLRRARRCSSRGAPILFRWSGTRLSVGLGVDAICTGG